MSEIPLGAIARVPGLIIRMLFTAMKFKRKVKKSARKLRRAMIKGGMNKHMASLLATRYEESVSIRRLISGATGSDFKLSSFFPF
ncbi:MAG: hypothetical protein Q7J68_07485 [Thermoplasmata archaeon]|nr:hypothetical protein [Thermoplasmata archaeon]